MSKHKCRRYSQLIVSVAALVLLVTGCGNAKKSSTNTTATQEPVMTEVSQRSGEITMGYNLTIKAVIKKMDTQAGVVQMQSATGGAEYTLTYSSGTVIQDKYGKSKLPENVKEGDVVEAYINDTDATLAGICYSSENWEFQGSENWKFNTEKSELNIGKTKYYFSDDMVILSDGKEITTMDLNESDVLNIQGCGKKVLSVTVERGHGYVKLEGIEDFIGGWVEIGKVIKPISKDMLIVVPEGNWDVTIVKDGYGGSIAATIERNQESTVDFTEVAAEIVRYGTVEFDIVPEDAILYIAGREVDWTNHILLEYDTYKIRVSADGYEDYTGDLKVEKALVGKKITLTEEGASEKPDSSEETKSTASPSPSASVTIIGSDSDNTNLDNEDDNNSSDDNSNNKDSENKDSTEVEAMLDYKINVKSPIGVNVYFDDAYVGVSPVSFTKISGDHTLTFSKEGYVTKSYSVEIGKEEKDVSFELPDLEHER